MPTQFYPRRFGRLIAGVAVLTLLTLFIHLGQWQAKKAEAGLEQRERYAARAGAPPVRIDGELVDAKAMEFARVSVRGEYEPERQFYIDNQLNGGQPGVHVVTPLKIEGGDTRILVNRGWIGWPDRSVPPAPMRPPPGPQQLTGLVAAPAVPAFLLMPERAEAFAGLQPALDVPRFARESGLAVQPLALYLDHEDGLVPFQPEPADKVDMHRGYAMQWYGIAVALVVFYAVVLLRKTSQGRGEPGSEGGGAA